MIAVNKIHNGDCLELMKEIPDKSIDCIICDLPYGTTACSWDTIIPFDKLWEQYKRIRKDNTPIILFGSEPFSTYLRMSNIKEFKYDLIWDKMKGRQPYLAKIQPMKSHENISVFAKNKTVYNPQMELAKKENMRDRTKNYNKGCYNSIWGEQKKYHKNNDLENFRYPKTVISISGQSKEINHKRLHPTQKPVALLEYLIKTYSNEGDLILDNCSGSGSLAIACHNLKRRFICIEKNYDYWKASVERLENAKAQLKLF